MLIDLWVGCSNIWQNTSEASRIHCVLRDQGSRKISDPSNFSSFYFCIQKAHTKYTKISTIRKFPAIWYVPLTKVLVEHISAVSDGACVKSVSLRNRNV